MTFKEIMLHCANDQEIIDVLDRFAGSELEKTNVSEKVASLMEEDASFFISNYPTDIILRIDGICMGLSDYTSSVYQLLKMGYDYDELHRQFLLVDDHDVDCESIHFYTTYLRYAKAFDKLDKWHKNNCFPEYEKYLPDTVVEDSLDVIMEYVYEFVEKSSKYRYEKMVGQRYEELRCLETEIEYNSESYVFSMPKTVSEIVDEALNMRCCIASRIEEYCKGEWIFAFMRKKSEPDKHYADIVINRRYRNISWMFTEGHIALKGVDEEVATRYFIDTVLEKLPKQAINLIDCAN